VRTYNFPENRISDHRWGSRPTTWTQVIDGDLGAVINALLEADRTSKIAGHDAD